MGSGPAILFDLDGVLADTEPVHGRAIDAVLATMGEDAHEFEPGLCDEVIFSRALPGAPAPEIRRAMQAKAGVFIDMIREDGAPEYPGVTGLVRALAGEVPLGVCSSSQRAEIDAVLESLGVTGCFRTITGFEDVERTKPDPQPYRLAAASLGFEASGCIAIEDSPTGLRAALDAGCRTLALTHTTDREHLIGAHRIVGRLGDLSAEEILGLVST